MWCVPLDAPVRTFVPSLRVGLLRVAIALFVAPTAALAAMATVVLESLSSFMPIRPCLPTCCLPGDARACPHKLRQCPSVCRNFLDRGPLDVFIGNDQ